VETRKSELIKRSQRLKEEGWKGKVFFGQRTTFCQETREDDSEMFEKNII